MKKIFLDTNIVLDFAQLRILTPESFLAEIN